MFLFGNPILTPVVSSGLVMLEGNNSQTTIDSLLKPMHCPESPWLTVNSRSARWPTKRVSAQWISSSRLSWVSGAVHLGWNIGVAIAYTILPNDLAARIMSSPISFVAFVWTNYFTREIPREIAEDALNKAIQTAAELAQEASDSGVWAVVVEPWSFQAVS